MTVQLKPRVSLSEWRLFVHVAQVGSFTEAAILLETPQSVVSRSIRRLEQLSGRRLFLRTGRGVVLTDFGVRIYERARRLVEEGHVLDDEFTGRAHDISGVVAVGTLPSISSLVAGRLQSMLRQQYPSIHLQLVEGSSYQLDDWLKRGLIDISIPYRYRPVSPQEKLLGQVDSYLVSKIGDPLTASASVSFSKLHFLPLVLPASRNETRVVLDRIAKEQNIAIRPALEVDSLSLQKELAIVNRCYAILPMHAIRAEVEAKIACAAKIVDPPFGRSVVMEVAAAKRGAPHVATVADMLESMIIPVLSRSD